MNIPEKGFYYHYKHDPDKGIYDYAYEVLNIAHHTEMHDSGDAGLMVIYRPIYEAFVYREGKHWDARPLPMFTEPVQKDGKEIERFSRITDRETISRLEEKVKEMYEE